MNFTSEKMIKTSPGAKGGRDVSALARCIDECFACAQTCTSCADACLGEPKIDMLRQCIRLNLDCADVCAATGRVLSRISLGTSQSMGGALVQACAAACAECATECERHAAMHEHCKVCAEACRRCEAACRAMLAS